MTQQQQPQGKHVRRVSQVDVTRNMHGQQQFGGYQLELTLDDGVEEYVLAPAEQEMPVLLRLFQHSESILFDKRSEDLTFQNYHG